MTKGVGGWEPGKPGKPGSLDDRKIDGPDPNRALNVTNKKEVASLYIQYNKHL